MRMATAPFRDSLVATLSGLVVAVASVVAVVAQGVAREHALIEAARVEAGDDHHYVFTALCEPPTAPRPEGVNPANRSAWHMAPAKVFDNLYFVGQTDFSAWVVSTSAGLIVIDALWDYSVEEEIVGGLRLLGLDPATIKYVIVSHGHLDHAGGARYLQEKFNARVMLSAADWDLVERDTGTWPKPKRDMVIVDGQALTLGDTTLRLHLTPGHTLGTVSTIIPIKDGDRRRVAAAWGGTAFNWLRSPERYITPDRPNDFWFRTYSTSARRFAEIAAKAGAEVLISNHTYYDGTHAKLKQLRTRKSGEPHPWVVGQESVRRFMSVLENCADAGRLRFR